jgi:acyl carrier protein
MDSTQRVPTSHNRRLESTIIQIVTSTLGKKPSAIKVDDPLFSSRNGFDSFSLMELVLHLEERFGINIPDEDLDPDIFYSITTIVSYIRDHIKQKD